MHYLAYCATFALFLVTTCLCTNSSFEVCAGFNWIRYNDEKCFKIIDDTLRSFDDAQAACAEQEHASILPVIRSSEEQEFLSNYLFKTQRKVDNFWIGAKFSIQSNLYKWPDSMEMNYTNWDVDRPKNRSNTCVQLQADDSVSGKWKDGPCERKNAVLCQKNQFWSHDVLQNAFLISRKEHRDALGKASDNIRNLTHYLENAHQRISKQKQNLANAAQQIVEQKISLENAHQKIDQQKQNLASANQKIDEQKQNLASANQKIDEQKQNLASANQKIDQQKQNLENINHRINELKQNFANVNQKVDDQKRSLIPVGFIYSQMPNQKAPAEIWPWMTWTDVSLAYAGVFFRVIGGGAEPFGLIQAENVPRITEVERDYNNISVFATKLDMGSVSDWIYTGDYSKSSYESTAHLRFTTSGGEVRPRNMAIRVWKRTG